MSSRNIFPAAALLAAAILTTSLWAEDGQDTKSTESKANYAQLVKQLDADGFADRQVASQKLTAAGKAAIPALTEAAQSNSRETAMRALNILKKHFSSSNKELKDAAKAALEKIANGNNAVAAGRAQKVLNPPKPQNPVGPGGIRIAPGARIQIGGQIQIRVGGAAGGIQRNIQVNNGVKTIETKQNGKTTRIVDDPQKGIKMTVTEKKNGKEVTKKYEAKNAAELKKKHPEAYKIYQEQSRGIGIGPGGAGIQIQGIQIGGGGAPGGIQIQGIPVQQQQQLQKFREEAAKRAIKQIEAIQKQQQEQIERLKQQPGNDQKIESLKKSIQRLEENKKQFRTPKAAPKPKAKPQPKAKPVT